jgi:hypothetical protein
MTPMPAIPSERARQQSSADGTVVQRVMVRKGFKPTPLTLNVVRP